MPWMNVELSDLLNAKWKIFFRKGNRNSCCKWWSMSFADQETTKQLFLRPYRESAMFKLLARDLWCSGRRDWTTDRRQTFIVQSSTIKLPPITGQCQCNTKCLLSRIVKEFSLVTWSVSARKKAQRYTLTGRELAAVPELHDAPCRGRKGTLSSPRGRWRKVKKIQRHTSGLNPIFGTKVAVAGNWHVICIMWAERKLGHREKQNSQDAASNPSRNNTAQTFAVTVPQLLPIKWQWCSHCLSLGYRIPNQVYGSTLSDLDSTISGATLMPAFP